MYLIQLTVVSIDGVDLSTPTVYGFDIHDIVEPISNNGVTSAVVVRTIKSIDQQARAFSKRTFSVSEDLPTITALSDFLFLCNVTSRKGRAASYERVFVDSLVSGEGLVPVVGGTEFYYAEDGDPDLVLYGVSETVAQIVAQGAIVSNGWNLGGNAVGIEYAIGTLTNFDFPIITNSTEKARFTTGGHFGLGVASPLFRMDVNSGVNALTAIARFANTGVNFKVYANDSSPEGIITGDPGDLCVVDDGITGALYQKVTGVATNTGWSQLDSTISDDWNLTGNTLSGGEKFGSINAQHVDFYSNNILRNRLRSTGETVIGDSGAYASQLTVYNTSSNVSIQTWIASSGGERMRINDAGNFLVGVTSAPTVFASMNNHLSGRTMIGIGDNSEFLVLPRYSGGTPYAFIAAVASESSIGTSGIKLQTANAGVAIDKFAIEGDSRVVMGTSAVGFASQLYVQSVNAAYHVAQFLSSGVLEALRVQEDLKTIAFGGLYGTDVISGDLTIGSTTNAAKGRILFGTSHYDEVNNFLGLGLGVGALHTLDLNGSLGYKHVSTAINYNVAATDLIVYATVDAITVTLPSAVVYARKIVVIKNLVANPSTINVASVAGTIDGAVSDTIVNSVAGVYNVRTYHSDGANWNIIA